MAYRKLEKNTTQMLIEEEILNFWDEQKIFDNMDYFYGKVDEFIEKFYREIDN